MVIQRKLIMKNKESFFRNLVVDIFFKKERVK